MSRGNVLSFVLHCRLAIFRLFHLTLIFSGPGVVLTTFSFFYAGAQCNSSFNFFGVHTPLFFRFDFLITFPLLMYSFKLFIVLASGGESCQFHFWLAGGITSV